MSDKKIVTLLILRGLPGSGKSTFAQKIVEDSKANLTDNKWKRINKDALREMLDLDDWNTTNECLLNQVVERMIYKYLRNGFSVVSDNMNLSSAHIKTAVEIANTINDLAAKGTTTSNGPVPYVQIQIKDFDTPLEVCIERDSKRKKPVTEPEIRFIAQKFMHAGFPDVSAQLSKLSKIP